ncbi:hypothetical protein QVD17_38595 [Tagetes erecta]|uniref:Wax synthase domain-containing protein n=1 Tax=Tagetes erecta TaxID=13708 RepID=A0AAD8JM24_TARER|nr:hypothetical protein QVD17_38595 [Tagetes erecta]
MEMIIANNFIIYISTIIASLSYCYYISSKIPRGIYRFISIVPVLYVFTILPLRCSFVFPTAVTFSFTTWLTNFKLIRFAFDLDHSPYHPSYSLLQFITFTSLPIKTRITNSTSLNSSPNRFQFKLLFQMLIFFLLVKTTLNYKLHPKILSFIYGWLLFFLIDIVAALSNAMLFLVTGLELEPSSDHPYIASSLQNFWGRWNLLVTNTMRHTVYKPVVLVFSNYKWAPLVGILVSFLVSGLMHELFIYQLTRAAPTWEMTLFFVVHGVCVVVEMMVKRALTGGRWRLPDFVARLLTVGFIMMTGVLWFVPPYVRAGIDVRMLKEYRSFVNFIKAKFSQIL